ncbi:MULTISPECIES: DinB family protein [Paenibacillus]|uniref:DinB-like domain-containing protein n=1 Tax=Paenibacillus albilobatus TaxID=2716884 RepID=A0A919XJW0_9BACL|nr:MULTISPECIES: DinB family protein [Paenibacillus]GIO34281.1 hypothetical protein J2TS6_54220 [Paenibacillus albilobatus]
MKNALERLNQAIAEVPAKFREMPEPELSLRPQPEKWSRKEILGHLCDSALNNLQRFVRSQYEPQPNQIIPYTQDEWVQLMGYQELPFDHVLMLWSSLNKQVAAVWERIPAERLDNVFLLGDGQTVTLQWVIDDYVDHLEHHLKQICGAELYS